MGRVVFVAIVIGTFSLTGTAYAAGNVAAGKTESTTCAMCHGAHFKGTNIAPRLAGLPPSTIEEKLEEFKAGKIDNAMMEAQARRLSPQKMANLAAYFGSLK